MLHPSYSDLIKVVNSDVEPGEQPIVRSRYSIVIATAKRARQIIAGDEPLTDCPSHKPLSIAVEELVSTESLPKTILALAGVDVGDAMIGEDLLDVVEKKDHNRPNQVFAQISESRVGRCVRTADYLYSVYAPGVNGGEAAASDLYADDFLYDLKADPWQLNNVVADPAYGAVKQDMRARLLDWIEKAEGTRPTIVD